MFESWTLLFAAGNFFLMRFVHLDSPWLLRWVHKTKTSAQLRCIHKPRNDIAKGLGKPSAADATTKAA